MTSTMSAVLSDTETCRNFITLPCQALNIVQALNESGTIPNPISLS